jgi:putative ABC transport system permease protein
MHEPHHERRLFWYLGRRRRTVEAEIDEELALHLEMRARELIERGVPPEEARREARRQFGDLEGTRRYCRQEDERKEKRMQRWLVLDDLVQDLRMSLRGLRRAPLITAVIVATVGLGIGATTVAFAAIHATLLRPLPYAAPERLVRIYTDAPPNRFPFSVADYLALQAQQTRFERIAGYTGRAMSFSDGAVAERLRGRVVTATYFSLLGIRPMLGRDFTESDARPGTGPAVIVSHGFWERRLSARADVIGESIRLDGTPHTVVGVLPPRVGPLERGQEFFVAAQWQPPRRKGPFFITVLGRLRSRDDRAAAAEELRLLNRRLFPVWQASYQDEKASWAMMDLKAHVVGDVETMSGLALASVALVWLIACANASNLLMARATSRRRELAVRAALGASRARVTRFLLAESALLAFGAAVVGIVLAFVGVGVLRRMGSAYVPRVEELGLDGAVWSCLCGLTAASTLLFGLVPSLQGSGAPVDETLRSLGRSSTASLAVRRLRRALVAAQFAIATPLLVVASLLLVSLGALGQVSLGFDTRNLLTASIELPRSQYAEPGRVAAFWDEMQRRVEALPGVTGVAFADGRPPEGVDNFNNFELEAFPTSAGHSQPVTPWISVTPEYFGLLGLRLVEGRLFDGHDGLGPNLESVIVDRAWARRFFPGGSAVGKRLHEGGCSTCPWVTVIGVVSEVKYAGLDKPDQGTVYTPMLARGVASPLEEATSRFRYVVVRTSADPLSLAPSVRQIVRDLDPTLPLSSVATLDDLVARSLQSPRSLSMLVGGFAAVALVLSIVGIYGVMAYYVQQHSKDISIRMALGGRAGDVLRLVLGQGMRVVAYGVAVGLLAALFLARLMASLLFGVSAHDGPTFLAVAMVLLGAAAAACFLPARRAIGLAPAVLLRSE